MKETIGRYRIQRILGEGGMGVVYGALDESLGRPVAIKMIRQANADKRTRERLRREARAAASVSHPNICQLYEVSEEDGELFIVMELLEGESLATRIGRQPLSLSEATEATLSILAALEALHRRGIVHRDLKPSNVFLTPVGLKLLDFGLARPMDSASAQTEARLTLPGTIVGTPHYLAPEQLLDQRVDARSDLFAAGAVIFEMLSGEIGIRWALAPADHARGAVRAAASAQRVAGHRRPRPHRAPGAAKATGRAVPIGRHDGRRPALRHAHGGYPSGRARRGHDTTHGPPVSHLSVRPRN